MRDFIKTHNQTGECEVFVDKIIEKWNNRFSISKWKDEYTFVISNRAKTHSKCKISIEQALEIIEKLDLFAIKSETFNSGTTYKNRETIENEITRLTKMYNYKKQEIKTIEDVLYILEKSLM